MFFALLSCSSFLKFPLTFDFIRFHFLLFQLIHQSNRFQRNFQQFGWDQVTVGCTFIQQSVIIERQSIKFGFDMPFTVLCKKKFFQKIFSILKNVRCFRLVMFTDAFLFHWRMKKSSFFIELKVKHSFVKIKLERKNKRRKIYSDGRWDLNNIHLIVTGKSRESVRCMINVGESIWCGVANRIYVIDAQTLEVRVKTFFSLIFVSISFFFLRSFSETIRCSHST